MTPTDYRVLMTPTARGQANAAAEFIALDSPTNARRWLDGLERAIQSLEGFPQRCARAIESEHTGEDLRHYIFHSHRIIFRIDEDDRTVWVLHVRHAAQRAIGEDESR